MELIIKFQSILWIVLLDSETVLYLLLLNIQIIVKAVPVREGHNLEMMFPITPEIQNYLAAPSRYLGHLIGHEADGSLFALLKKLGEA